MAMRDKDELAEEYMECYKNGIPLSKLKASTEEFNVFKLKRGLPVKYISTKNKIKLPMDDKLIGYNGFYQRQKGFYLIPNEYKNKIISFVIRGLSHEYFDIHMMSPIKPMFGWYMFEDYKKGYPIIITEGSKDCIILQQYYPYVLAMLTAGVTVSNLNILSCMTNKIILAYDKDDTGVKTTKAEIKKFQDKNFLVQTLKPKRKDFGMDYNNSEYLEQEIINKLKAFKTMRGLIGCLK